MADEETARMEEMLDNLRADRYPLASYEHIGKRGPRRIDGVHKASGSAEYTMDIQLPGMLHMRFLTSPYPHAPADQHAASPTDPRSSAQRSDSPRTGCPGYAGPRASGRQRGYG